MAESSNPYQSSTTFETLTAHEEKCQSSSDSTCSCSDRSGRISRVRFCAFQVQFGDQRAGKLFLINTPFIVIWSWAFGGDIALRSSLG